MKSRFEIDKAVLKKTQLPFWEFFLCKGLYLLNFQLC